MAAGFAVYSMRWMNGVDTGLVPDIALLLLILRILLVAEAYLMVKYFSLSGAQY